MEEKIYTAEQVRAILDLKTVRTVHRYIKRGQLNAFTIGNDYRIRASALEQFIENRDAKKQRAKKAETEEEKEEYVGEGSIAA